MEEIIEDKASSVILTEHQFKSLLGMLASTKEDKDLAFMCINRLDPELNLALILLLRKKHNDHAEWTNRCIKHTAYHRSLGIENHEVLSTDIYKYLDRGPKEVNEKMFLEFVVERIKLGMNMMFLRDAEITIKLKKKNE